MDKGGPKRRPHVFPSEVRAHPVGQWRRLWGYLTWASARSSRHILRNR